MLLRFLLLALVTTPPGLANEEPRVAALPRARVTPGLQCTFCWATGWERERELQARVAESCSFKWDLDKKIIVRTNSADYPATKDRPAFSHRDLTVLYENPGSKRLEAIYFDNEGHVINYAVAATKDPGVLQLTSEPSTSNPRYRLTYTRTGSASVSIRFEIAPPGKPDAFSPYVEATARRK